MESTWEGGEFFSNNHHEIPETVITVENIIVLTKALINFSRTIIALNWAGHIKSVLGVHFLPPHVEHS